MSKGYDNPALLTYHARRVSIYIARMAFIFCASMLLPLSWIGALRSTTASAWQAKRGSSVHPARGRDYWLDAHIRGGGRPDVMP
jgi:hypothetical protein